MRGLGAAAILFAGLAATADAREALNCSITPNRVIEIAAPIDGVLAEVMVRPGDQVAKGDPLARIDTSLVAAELAAAEARAGAKGGIEVARAKRAAAASQYSSAAKAFKERLISRMEHDRMRGDLAVADRELKSAAEQVGIAEADAAHLALMVEKGVVLAPASGVIGEELLNQGESVDGRPLAQLIVTDPLRVEVFATQAAVEEIEAGVDYVVLAGAASQKRLAAELDYISPLADQGSRTIKVYYHIRGGGVRPGTRCLLVRADAPTGTASN